MHEHIRRCVIESPTTGQNRDWLSFFVGGVVGSLIILGLDKLYEKWKVKQVQEKSESKVSSAFNTELESNVEICTNMIESLDGAKHSVFNFTTMSTVWMDKYCENFIDYTDSDSLRLYSYLNGIKKLVDQINAINSNQLMLSVNGRALSSFEKLASNNNTNLYKLATECMSVFIAVKEKRRGNKILHNEISANIVESAV